MYVCRCMYVRMHVYVCMSRCTPTNTRTHDEHVEVCSACQYMLYIYVCMCNTYVLRPNRPAIPYITPSRYKRLHNFRPVEILLHERGYRRVPPCNVLKMSFFLFFFKSNHFIFFVLKKSHFIRGVTQGSPLVNPLHRVFEIL